MDKYKPKAVVIFSAHWEAEEHYLVSDYEGRNPILYDYYGCAAPRWE
jgi:aromatic ring-opening dioxygenase catalytic subunit (LigB family)